MTPLIRRLALLGCVALCVSAFAAEPLSILGYTKSTSFWVELPPGWRCDPDAGKQSGAMFVLLPQEFTFDSAPVAIVATSFQESRLDEAMKKDRASFLDQDPEMQVSDLNPVATKSGARFSVREFRSQRLKQQGFEAVAYTQLGPDVVVLTLSAQTETRLRDGQKIFRKVLSTFENAKLKVATSQ